MKRGRLTFESADYGDTIRVIVDKGADVEYSVKFANDASVEEITAAKDTLVAMLTDSVPFDFMLGTYQFMTKEVKNGIA